MSFYKKVKTVFSSKREREVTLTREDIDELEKIIQASKDAFQSLKKSLLSKGNFENEDDPIGGINCTPREEGDESEILEQGRPTGNRSAHGGIAFEVEFEPAKKVRTKPKELHPENSLSKPLIDYSSDEKALMAEIIRDDIMTERSVKAAQEEVKRFDVNRRRLVKTADAEARVAGRQNEPDKAIDMAERARRLKKLAANARAARLAAANKRTRS